MPADPQKQSKAEAVQKAQKAKKQAPVRTPDITLRSDPQAEKLRDLKSKFYEVRSNLT